MKDKLFTAIFLFKIEESAEVFLFSEVTLKEKLITAIYTDVKIDSHSIKLILNSKLAGNIITRQLMDQYANKAIKILIGKINNLPIEVNGIIILIKVLVMEATQYQALIGNNWLFKTNSSSLARIINTHVYQPCEAYQVSWTNTEHNKLSPVLSWNDKEKKKEKDISEETTTTEEIINGWEREYSHEPIKEPPYIPLKCEDCRKKLFFMGA
ncbi:hypothetical protein G9A89_008222 [Geosiphon pyriformis]|nr:hypothetical protein G9A89_008222 [Geosiphon pyriformis]